MAKEQDPTGQPPHRARDRRKHSRYAYTADAEVVEDASGTRIEARISDLSQQGCHVESDHPFSLGAVVRVQITKGRDSFLSPARVVFCSTRGMGLAFTEMAKEQFEILEEWLAPLRERDWLVQNRRKTQRVLMKVPVRVSGLNTLGSQFEEESYTVAVNANGALVALSAPIVRGQQLKLLNIATQDAAEVVVAHIARHQGGQSEVGISFILRNPNFWHVTFPPSDWTPPCAEEA